MATYYPEKWVIIRVVIGDESIEKVLAAYYGGFAGANSWKLSSGITKIIPCDDYYEIHNESGSVYICHHSVQGTSSLTASMFNFWKSQQKDGQKIEIVDIEMCDAFKKGS